MSLLSHHHRKAKEHIKPYPNGTRVLYFLKRLEKKVKKAKKDERNEYILRLNILVAPTCFKPTFSTSPIRFSGCEGKETFCANKLVTCFNEVKNSFDWRK